MTITNMQQPMQIQPGLRDPRQRYGLGSFVKKAIRGVKKIAKSPLGKAAIIGGLGMIPFGGTGTSMFGRMGGMMSGLGGGTSMNPFAQRAKGGFFKKGLGRFLNPWSGAFGEEGKFSGKHAFGLGAAALTAAPLFMGGKDDAEDVVESVTQLDPSATVQSAKNYYSNLGDKGVGLNFMPKKKYVNQNFYAADGGRANYADGQLVGPSYDGSRPGYAGDEKGFLENLSSGLSQIFSGQTGAVIGGDQKKINEFNVKDGWGLDNNFSEETLNMIIDMNNKGMDLDTIVSITGGDADSVSDVINHLNINMEQKAHGGRIGYAGGEIVEDEEEFIRTNAGQPLNMPQTFLNMGGGAGEAQAEQMLMAEFIKYKNKGGDLSFQEFVQAVMQQEQQAQGMGQTAMAANGGRMNAANGGIMDTEASEMIDMNGGEKDYRETGGFVELGGEERADDVPARLSKNEFVFTADAVRAAGGGDIDQGSEVMQNMMDNLEQGGQISEDSQGLGGEEMMSEEEIIEEPNGAQAMYEQQQALQSRMI